VPVFDLSRSLGKVRSGRSPKKDWQMSQNSLNIYFERLRGNHGNGRSQSFIVDAYFRLILNHDATVSVQSISMTGNGSSQAFSERFLNNFIKT